MDSTFYKEEGPKFLAEQKVRLQALGMSFHSRLGSMSHLGKIPEEIFQHQLAPYIINGGDLFPQLHPVDGEYDTGIFAQGFNLRNAHEIDPSLLLRVTVSYQGREETLFSGKVLPQAYNGTLRIRTHRSMKGYHHYFIIKNRGQGKFSIETAFHGMQEKMYGFQVQDIADQNWSIRQDTPQGNSVEISRVIPCFPLPFALPWLGLQEPSILYTMGPREISSHNQNFKFMILVSNQVIFQGPIVNPNSPRETINCRMEHGRFSLTAGINFIKTPQGINCFELSVTYFQFNDSPEGYELDIGRQYVLLDDPEPQQHMRQDLLSGYISLRVERLADALGDS